MQLIGQTNPTESIEKIKVDEIIECYLFVPSQEIATQILNPVMELNLCT